MERYGDRTGEGCWGAMEQNAELRILFHCYSNPYYKSTDKHDYHEEPRQGSNTWGNLLSWLDEARIPRSACFYTNLFPGIRIAKKHTGPSTALRDKALVMACVDFLDTQIQILRPCAVVIMGMESIYAILRRWLPQVDSSCYKSWRAIDQNTLGCFTTERLGRQLKVGLVTHPSINNSWRRQYNGATGLEAELAILRECFSTRKTI